MLTVVYVLVSTEKDYFYEQFLVSLTSLRYRMSEVNVILLIEQDTNQYIQTKHKEINELVEQIIVHELPAEYSMVARSRILKTMMRQLVNGDFLYIDCDTVICSSLEDIQKVQYSSAVLDNHCEVTEQIVEFIPVMKRAERFGFSVGYQNKHFNGGVLWCKDDKKTREFFEQWNMTWNETYKKGIMIDQLSFNEVNNRMEGTFSEISGEWNCQLRYGLPYLSDAKIIHYFASNFNNNLSEAQFAYKFTKGEILIKVRECGKVPDDVFQLIKKPRGAFEQAIIIGAKSVNYYMIKSYLAGALRRLYRKHPKLFARLNSIAGKMKKGK